MMNDETKTPEGLAGRTKDFSLRVIRLFSSLPKTTVAQVIGKQILRSGTSVGANYREAHRARSKAEFIAKIGDCLKEIDETSYWLELLGESQTLPSVKLTGLLDESHQLLAIFTTIVKRAKSSSR